MSNHLKNEKSPYLLQHAENPVDWYPWGEEAFKKAKAENKPIFLSIGYSTCHWCHVMAHESFEDKDIADILNSYFISIKVDKEERPDIDSVYMSVCQTLTGSGGWPTSIFMTPEQKPFFAGTYFPKSTRYGMPGFKELLIIIKEKWAEERGELLDSADEIIKVLNKTEKMESEADIDLIESAVNLYKRSYDKKFGGFGTAPKFPSPHNLIFLMSYYEKSGDIDLLEMAENTLVQIYSGGIFDHIGYGFCRYSTDRYFLVPHFEKMLYDNALLITAYCRAYDITKKPFYKEVAEKTASYIFREMTSDEGAFYSAQDADSEGEEGKYYIFEPSEIINLLGEKDGIPFNKYYGITNKGNFEGKSIPNLLHNKNFKNEFDECLQKVYSYRLNRNKIHLDDKILTSWNSLMIVAMCQLYRISRKSEYLDAAKKAQQFIENKLCDNDALFVSYRDGKRGEKGFLDDYANYIFSLLYLYNATFDNLFIEKARKIYKKALLDFYDNNNGGFYLYGKDNEKLIVRPKETYDGAVPSGNSVMAYNLVHLFYLTSDKEIEEILKSQLNFLYSELSQYPAGSAMFLTALLEYFEPSEMITVVLKNQEDITDLNFAISLNSIVKIINSPTQEYSYKNDKTTFYICRNHNCMPATNDFVNRDRSLK